MMTMHKAMMKCDLGEVGATIGGLVGKMMRKFEKTTPDVMEIVKLISQVVR